MSGESSRAGTVARRAESRAAACRASHVRAAKRDARRGLPVRREQSQQWQQSGSKKSWPREAEKRPRWPRPPRTRTSCLTHCRCPLLCPRHSLARPRAITSAMLRSVLLLSLLASIGLHASACGAADNCDGSAPAGDAFDPLTGVHHTPTELQLQQSAQHSLTLNRIHSRLNGRGQLVCAHVDFTLGHSHVLGPHSATGMEPELCKGLAAALGVSEPLYWSMSQPSERFPLLQQGLVDVVFALTSKTISRDLHEAGSFSIPYFQDQHNLMTRSDRGISSGEDLAGKTVCATRGTTNPNVLRDYLASIDAQLAGGKDSVRIVEVDDDASALRMMREGSCDAFVNDDSVVAGYVHTEAPVSEGVQFVLASWTGTPFARAPFSAVTLDGDAEWASIVDWFINSLFLAEMYGVTSQNVDRLYADRSLPGEAQRLLGSQLIGGKRLPFDMRAAIKSIGNYAELYERNFGAFLPRSRANMLYKDGGAVFPGGFR